MEYFLRNIIIIFVTSALIFSCTSKNEDNKSPINNIVSKDGPAAFKGDTVPIFIDKKVKKQDIKTPDYIPPSNGGNNRKWCNNRHKLLTNDSNCYFGKGLQKRHRYRWGRQNSE